MLLFYASMLTTCCFIMYDGALMMIYTCILILNKTGTFTEVKCTFNGVIWSNQHIKLNFNSST